MAQCLILSCLFRTSQQPPLDLEQRLQWLVVVRYRILNSNHYTFCLSFPSADYPLCHMLPLEWFNLITEKQY